LPFIAAFITGSLSGTDRDTVKAALLDVGKVHGDLLEYTRIQFLFRGILGRLPVRVRFLELFQQAAR